MLSCVLAVWLAGTVRSASRPVTVKDGLIDTTQVGHSPDGLDQIVWSTAENPSLRFLFLRMAMKADDVFSAGVRTYSIGDQGYESFKDHQFEPYAKTGDMEYRGLTLPFEDEPTADDLHSRWRGYRLWLDDGDRILWVGSDTMATKEDTPHRFERLIRPKNAVHLVPGSVDPAESGVSDRVLVIPSWVSDAVFYRIVPDRFRNGNTANDPPGASPWDSPATPDARYGGDLEGVIQALPYLDSLGVTALYLAPIFMAAGNLSDGTANYDSVDSHYGGEAAFARLIDLAHKRRMKVLIEGTFGSVADVHPYFKDAVDFGLQSDLWSWFHFRDYPVVRDPEPNYATWNGRADRPLWNLDNPDTRNYLFNVVRRWMDMGVDGWGLVAPESAPHEFWYQFREAVKAMNARAFVVGTVAGDVRPWMMGDQFDAVTDRRLENACAAFFADTTLDAQGFDEILSRIRVSTPDPLLRISFNAISHPDSLPKAAVSPALEKLETLFQMTYTGAPVIDSGDEVGVAGAGLRGPFPWTAGTRNGSVADHYRLLLQIRREHAALRRGSFSPAYTSGGIYAFVRRSSEEVLMVVLNRTSAPATFKISLPKGAVAVKQKDAFDLLTGSKHAIRSSELYVKDVAPFSGAILQIR